MLNFIFISTEIKESLMDANTIDQFYFDLIPCWASSTFLETLKQLLISSQCLEQGQVFFDDSLDQRRGRVWQRTLPQP